MNNFCKKISKNKKGSAFLFVMIFGFIGFMTITIGMISYTIFESKAAKSVYRRDIAFHIAEAGIDYYRWHLISFPDDYYDGQSSTSTGPYVHNYYDKDGNIVGTFSLEIDAPPQGTHVVVVRSTGWSIDNTTSKRTIQAYFGYESFSNSSFVVNSDMSFSSTSFVHGKTFANGCIKFDGTSDSWVDSASQAGQCGFTFPNYNDGVYGSGGPKEFWRDGQPTRSFSSVSADFTALKNMANQSDGMNLGYSYPGWHIVFQDDGTFKLYKIGFADYSSHDISSETLQGTFSIPANGVIYAPTDVWVEGIVAGRVTVVADSYGSNIYIPGDLTYKDRYGDNILGLLADTDIVITFDVPDDMKVDGALLAKNGSIYRDYYYSYMGAPYIRNSLSMFGSQIENQPGGFKYVSYGTITSGFINTIYTYDGNLRYKPPIGIPVIPEYKLISWQEIN